MNKQIHPAFQSILQRFNDDACANAAVAVQESYAGAAVCARDAQYHEYSAHNPLHEASQKLASQERELALAADVIRAQALRIKALKSILEDIAPSDLESEEEATYGLRIPQSVVIDAIKELMRVQHIEFAGILETKFAEWVKRERDTADIAAWEDRQS